MLQNKFSIQHLIENEFFYHYTQSLFCTKTLKKIGREILLRSDFGTPDVIFKQAKEENKLYELDTKSINKLFQSYHLQNNTSNDHLFINIFPSTILQQEFPDFLKNVLLNIPKTTKNNIVFEIIEKDYVENIQSLKERICDMKDLGFQIAIDDAGTGWSSLHMIIELEPNYIKLDRYFAKNLSTTEAKQQMIKVLMEYASYSNSKVVLEGIEFEEDFEMAKTLGVHICQGFLLDQPKPLTSMKKVCNI